LASKQALYPSSISGITSKTPRSYITADGTIGTMEKGVLYPILFSLRNLTTPSALISPNAEQPVSSTALTTF